MIVANDSSIVRKRTTLKHWNKSRSKYNSSTETDKSVRRFVHFAMENGS